MKNLLFISLLFLTLTFTGCSKDDKPIAEPTNPELIVGKWYIESINDRTTGLNDCEKQTYFEFLDDNSLSILSFALNASDECVPLDSVIGDYNFTSETELILTTPDIIQTLGIILLTDKKMILSSDDGSGNTVLSSFRK